MSEAVTALDCATFDGYCTVSDAGLVGMVTLRGDLARGDAGEVDPGQRRERVRSGPVDVERLLEVPDAPATADES